MSNETKTKLKEIAAVIHNSTNYIIIGLLYTVVHFLQVYETRFVATENKTIQLEQADIKTNNRIDKVISDLDHHEEIDKATYVKVPELRQSYTQGYDRERQN